jgi:hypothetical protein
MALEQELFVPDRFEALRSRGGVKLEAIVTPVSPALARIDERFKEMRASDRGGLMILRGDTGSGKSTFLDTVPLFRRDVRTDRITFVESIGDALQRLGPANSPRVVVLEGREALGTVSDAVIEEGLHAVNSFIRSDAGKETLVVWPVNTNAMADNLARTAMALGGEALLGETGPVEVFGGPGQAQFVPIAERTVAALNEGASLGALGISEERAVALREGAETIGTYLGRIRTELLKNEQHVRGLVAAERCRVWTIVIAGNEPEGDVAALTRGGYAYADVDRLLTATGANIVADLKKSPEKLGILGTVLDARIVHMDMVAALAVCRTYGTPELHTAMQGRGMAISSDTKVADRILGSEIGLLLQGRSLGTRKRGPKPGSNTVTAFENVAEIARTNDIMCNKALGEALVATGLVDGYETERDLGTGLSRRTDIYCSRGDGPIRLEVMWRSKAGRADIANYVLTKLANYGKAIAFLD